MTFLFFSNVTTAFICCASIAPKQTLFTFGTGCANCTAGAHWPPDISQELYTFYSTTLQNQAPRIARLQKSIPPTRAHELAPLFQHLKHQQTLLVPNSCGVPTETAQAWELSPHARTKTIVQKTTYTFEDTLSYSYLFFHAVTICFCLLGAKR